MSEADDLKTIATLLGNLIDRIEKVEELQTKTMKHLALVREHTKKQEEQERTFRKAVFLLFEKVTKKLP